MEYKPTLNVTLGDKQPGAMPQRGSLPTREPDIQKYWDEIDLYRLSLEKDAPEGTFILHDGPPYSNGDIHLGHALNKIAKDIIVKYKTMAGFRSPYVPGWDNHGMPIENNVSKEFRARGERPDKVTMRRRCRTYAADYVDRQRVQFRRLGVRGDWFNPYLTMNSDFESAIVRVFGEMAEKGFVYRGLKPVMWCADCETALADAEIEYEDHVSTSIYVRFPVVEDPNGLFGGDLTDAYVVIWTTTPWTIPANLALAVHPDARYVVVNTGDSRILVAEPLAARTLATIGAPNDDWESAVLARALGNELAGLVAKHPLFDRPSPVVEARYVTMEDGTGVVHTAPGHGKEDFETGAAYGLDVLCPVAPDGSFTLQAGERFVGKRILDGSANAAVLEALTEAGHLLAKNNFSHSYPHCWRCHYPLLFRATVQWFMNIDHETDGKTHRQASLEAIDAVKWYPPVSIQRIKSMVGGRPDWCLSRQRAWGVGIPAFYCRDCATEILDKSVIDRVADRVAETDSDVWFAESAAELLPEGFKCPKCNGTEFDKETDILDVWFDSGSTHRAVLENSTRWPELSFPADVYLEGSDQHRGWFNSSLMIGVATRGTAPYKSVITNGWTLDELGKAMHKTHGNAVSPNEVTDKFGADILRLWVASTDYFEDVRCSDSIIQQVTETYRRIRNTFRFLVNNLYRDLRTSVGLDFNPETNGVPLDEMHPLDRWALSQLDKLIETCRESYESYEFHRVYHSVNAFCALEMSSFYLDVIKDRLYCSGAQSIERRSAQTAMAKIAATLAQLLAPILSHTSDEVWNLLGKPGGVLSAQLTEFPTHAGDSGEDTGTWAEVFDVRESVNQAVEAARQAKTIANPLESQLHISGHAGSLAALTSLQPYLPAIFKVSQVTLNKVPSSTLEVLVTPADGSKCARCWLVKTDVGQVPELADLCERCASAVAELEA